MSSARPPAAGSRTQTSNYAMLGGRAEAHRRSWHLDASALFGRSVDEHGRWLWLQGSVAHEWIRATAFYFDYSETLNFGTFGGQLSRELKFFDNALSLRPTLMAAHWSIDSLNTTYGVLGTTASYLHNLGPVFLQVGGDFYHAGDNGLARGQYMALNAGAFRAFGDVTVGLDLTQAMNPMRAETGYSLWASYTFGQSVVVNAQLARTVSDPFYGSPPSDGFTVMASWRFSQRTPPPPPLLAEVGAQAPSGRLVTFQVEVDSASSVAVSGTFSEWQPLSLKRNGSVWSGSFPVEPGTHQFGFLLNDSSWYVPPNAADVVDDGFGRKNVTLVVRPQ